MDPQLIVRIWSGFVEKTKINTARNPSAFQRILTKIGDRVCCCMVVHVGKIWQQLEIVSSKSVLVYRWTWFMFISMKSQFLATLWVLYSQMAIELLA